MLPRLGAAPAQTRGFLPALELAISPPLLGGVWARRRPQSPGPQLGKGEFQGHWGMGSRAPRGCQDTQTPHPASSSGWGRCLGPGPDSTSSQDCASGSQAEPSGGRAETGTIPTRAPRPGTEPRWGGGVGRGSPTEGRGLRSNVGVSEALAAKWDQDSHQELPAAQSTLSRERNRTQRLTRHPQGPSSARAPKDWGLQSRENSAQRS